MELILTRNVRMLIHSSEDVWDGMYGWLVDCSLRHQDTLVLAAFVLQQAI